MIGQEHRWATAFGEDAAGYDRTSPSYPAALIDDLMAAGPERVLDVGCGTGRAAQLFLSRGCDVLGVDPDSRMADIARGHGLAVEIAAFESWDAAGRVFDLVVSGQAWHWVDLRAGPARAASVLRGDGILAVFWNYVTLDDEMHALLADAYRANAPQLLASHVPGGRARDAHAFRDAIASDGRFTQTWIRQYDWKRSLRRAEWLDVLASQPDNRALAAERRTRLLSAVDAAIATQGGSVVVEYETELVTARRAR